MIYKPENVKLVITHNGGVEQEIHDITDYPISFDESTYFENPPHKKTIVEVMLNDECLVMAEEQLYGLLCEISKTKDESKKPKSKSSRCKDTIDWVEVEYGDEYKKPKKGESGKQSISSTLVKQLTKSEIESLRQNKRDAYALMMKMN